MKRYNFDDEEFDEETFFDGNKEEFFVAPDPIGFFSLNLAQQGLDQNLLFQAIKLAKSEFWWNFYSNKTKLTKIDEIYKGLIELLEKNNPDIEPSKE